MTCITGVATTELLAKARKKGFRIKEIGVNHYPRILGKPVFERAVSINPSYSNARYFLGLIYDREGKKDEAISQFEKIAELNPGNQEVERIIENLQVGKSALFGISPPEPEPQSRKNLPIEENAPNL